MEKITIGIIGGGRIGRMHAGTIYTGMQDVTIKYVSDIYPQAAQQWGPMYGWSAWSCHQCDLHFLRAACT